MPEKSFLEHINLGLVSIRPDKINDYAAAKSASPITNAEEAKKIQAKIQASLSPKAEVPIVVPSFWDNDYASPSEGSVLIIPITGCIMYKDWWGLSTSLVYNILRKAAADKNIVSVVLYFDTPGGETFLLHETAQLISEFPKPIYSVIDSVGCSAGYWLACSAQKVYASSNFSTIGSIGIMASYYDDQVYLNNMGIKLVEIYSSLSGEKNKIFDDVQKGNSKEYIQRFLDPLALQFQTDVKAARKNVAEDALTGNTYYSQEAISKGLIDGVKAVEDVITEAWAAGTDIINMIQDNTL